MLPRYTKLISLLQPKQYGRGFYDEAYITSVRSAQQIVPLVLELTGARSVIDVGCGTGGWLSVFSTHGVEEICGVDNNAIENAELQIPSSCMKKHDLVYPFTLDRRYDLAMCLEVAEHLPESSADMIVQNLTQLSSMVLFSAAIPHQGGVNHINEQWPEYWARKFHQFGFVPVDCLRETIWQNEEVAYWYAQNLILYVHESALSENSVLKDFAKDTNPSRLSMVHPKVYVKNYNSARSPKLLLMRLGWNLLPRKIRMALVKPLISVIWKQVNTRY